jgi:glycosyltransferase involved in cell wall biosynthesis
MHLFEGLKEAHSTGLIFDESEGATGVPTMAGFFNRFGPFRLVIGIDRGIVEAARVARTFRIPHALISYEIIFRDEAGGGFKLPEIEACRGIVFALCQDTIRAQHLARENHIPPHKIILIPLAGRGVRPGAKTDYLHAALGIPGRKRIALFIGSVSEMCAISGLIRNAATWPEDWVLVIHHRYGLSPIVRNYREATRGMRNIYFSTVPCEDFRDLGRLLHSADIGLAFYQMVKGSIYTGKNVGHIGMSSGKIATYLQHGLPVVTSRIGLMSRLIRHHQLGWVTNLGQLDLAGVDEPQLQTRRANCLRFFAQKLDLNVTAAPLLSRIERGLDGFRE